MKENKASLFEILYKFNRLEDGKKYILENIDNFDLKNRGIYDWNPLFYIINHNNDKELFFSKEDILSILNKFDLTEQSKDGLNILMHIIKCNSQEKLNFNKSDIIKILDNFDLTQKDKTGCNVLIYIIRYNKSSNLGFNKDDILSIMDKFNLKHQDNNDLNILMYIIFYNKLSVLCFNEEDIINLLDKFDLKQISNWNISVYDFIKNQNYNSSNLLLNNRLSEFIIKLGIEAIDFDNNNIFINELKGWLCFNSEELLEKILNTNNKEIINCVYNHIDQIVWKQKDLLFFLNKNNFILNEKSTKLI